MEADNIATILENLSSPDSKIRQAAIPDFIKYANDEDKSLKPEEIHQAVAALAISIKDNNIKICQAAMGAVETLVAYLTRTSTAAPVNMMAELVNPIAEQLGNSSAKSHVRMIAHDVLLSLMTVLTPVKTLTHLKDCFAHKNFRVKEMVIQLVHKTIEKFGKSEVRPDEWIDHVIAGLEDPQASVREAALKAIEGIYKIDHSLRALLETKNISKQHYDLIRTKLDNVDGIKQTQVVSPRSTLTSSRSSKHLSMEIKPIRISTDNDLAKEIEAMKVTFSSTDEWEQRVETLKMLQQMAQMGLHLNFPNFINYLKDLQDALAAQINDLRSSVVKEACATLSALAINLGEQFNPFVDVFFPALLKTTFVTIQVVSDAGDSCMKVMLKHTKPGQVVNKITAEAMKSKHINSRLRCNEYLLLLLKDKSKSYLDRYVEDIEQAIKKCVSDADKDVRASARACYCWFAKVWPDRGDKLLRTFDGTTQKYIAEEQTRILSQSSDELRSSSSSTGQPKRVPVGREKAGKAQATVTGMTKSGAMRVELPPSKSNPAMSTSGETVVVPKSTTAQRVLVADKPWKKKPTAQPATAKGAAPANKLQKSDGNEPEAPVTSTEPLAISDDLLIFDTNSFVAPSNTNPPKPSTALRISQQKDVNEELIAGNIDEKWQLIHVNAANSQNWLLRVDAFAEIKSLCGSDVFAAQVLNNSVKSEKLIKLFATHLFDAHFKVLNQCLDTLVKLITCHAKYIENNWSNIAPHFLKLLGGNTNQRDDTRQLIQSTIDALTEVSGANASNIFNATSKLLDSNDNKVKMGAMKFLEVFSNGTQKQHLAGANVKQTLKKILTCVKWDKASDLRKSAVDSLISIYGVNPGQFKAQLSTFNNAQREDLVKLLLPKIPTLLEEEPNLPAEDKSQAKNEETSGENLTSSGSLVTSRKQVENGLEELSPTCDFDVNSPNKVPADEVMVNNNNNESLDTRPESSAKVTVNGSTDTEPKHDGAVIANGNQPETKTEQSSTHTSEILHHSNASVMVNNNNNKSNGDDLEIDLTAAKEALDRPKVDLSSIAQQLQSNSEVERNNALAVLIDYVIDDEHDRPRQQAAVETLQSTTKTRADLHHALALTAIDMLTARKLYDASNAIYSCLPLLTCAQLLRERVTKDNAVVLAVFQAVLVHLPTQDVIEHVMAGPWFATLLTAFEKGEPAVRKTTVFCFVEISIKLEPSKYQSYFSPKNASHIKLQKLVDVYVNSKHNGAK